MLPGTGGLGNRLGPDATGVVGRGKMAAYRPQPADRVNDGCGVALDLVAGERLSAVLHVQRILLHPHGDLCSGESLFSVKLEALEGEIAEVVEGQRGCTDDGGQGARLKSDYAERFPRLRTMRTPR